MYYVNNFSLVENTESLSDDECDIITTSDIPVAHPTAEMFLNKNSSKKTEITNNILVYTILQNKMIGNTAEGSFNNYSCIAQDESAENDIVSIPVKSTKRNKMKTSTNTLGIINCCNTLCCKISLVFLTCCVIGFCSLSFVLYYVNQAANNDLTDPTYSAERNISNAKVCCKL